VYCKALKICVEPFRTCPPYNAQLKTPACTTALLEHFNRELSDHPPNRPDLTPSDYHMFTQLKNWLRQQRFDKNEDLMEDVKTWLSSPAAHFFDTGIQKLIPQYDKSFNSASDFVEK
jgi:hypothetical protein